MKPTDQRSGIYRTRDVIENFQFRISLRKLYSTIKIPKFEAFLTGTVEQQQSSTDFEEIVSVKWQQKVFSKTERLYYAQKENCKTELDKKYHQMVKESTESGLVFTYINDDSFQPADFFGPRDLEISKLRKNVEAQPKLNEDESLEMFVEPTKKFVSSRYFTGDDFVKMFIMADLDPTTLLVSIFYRQSGGIFVVYPDFNTLANEYLVEIDQNSKQLYGYHVENMSVTTSEATKKLAEKKTTLNKVQEETCELMKKLNIHKDANFEYPKFLRIVLMLEIVEGRDFEYDNIHVRFNINLPKFVKLVDGDLNGATHSSLKNSHVWNLGFCHSIVFDIDDEFLLSASKLDLITIKLEVISVDPLWERERREGITTFKLPIEGKNKQQTIDVTCYRDLQCGSWFRDFLERFFLGGIHKTQINDNNHNEVVNLYGNKTVSTGSLRLKIQKVTQMKMSKRNYLHLKSIDKIISSYHKAKARLDKE